MQHNPVPVVYFFTDFGAEGPYLAQMETALLAHFPAARVLNLVANAPPFSPRPASYLLDALLPYLAPGCVIVGVVDPGVGGERKAILLEASGRRFIGPDNGLFAALLRTKGIRCREIHWPASSLSATFHGRDLFAPAAGTLLAGGELDLSPLPVDELEGHDWPDELGEIIYIDHYGNAMSGLRAERLAPDARLQVGDRRLSRYRTFSDLPAGEMFWYENSIGLVEIAVNRGRACEEPGIGVGAPIQVI